MTGPASSADFPVSISGLTKRFGRRVLLEDVELVLAAGTVTALTGVSGVGKTTLLRFIAGLDAPDTGEIRIAGTLATAGSRILVPPHARGIAMVFQQPALWPHMNVVEHAGFGLPDIPDREKMALATLERLGIASLARSYPAELSGGEAARVALARALAPEPRCLLLDEPLAHLHADLRHDLAGIVSEATHANGTATLIVTHSPADLNGNADCCLRLEDGRLTTI